MKKSLPDNFIKTIKEIAQKLQDKDINWAIIGSTNMALHGIDIAPKDLDITTNLEGLGIISDIFSEHKVGEPVVKQPEIEGYKEFTEQTLELNGVEVQICGEYEDDIYYRSFIDGEIEEIDIEGVKVPVFSLKAEARAYRITKRKNKAKIIEDWLKIK